MEDIFIRKRITIDEMYVKAQLTCETTSTETTVRRFRILNLLTAF